MFQKPNLELRLKDLYKKVSRSEAGSPLFDKGMFVEYIGSEKSFARVVVIVEVNALDTVEADGFITHSAWTYNIFDFDQSRIIESVPQSQLKPASEVFLKKIKEIDYHFRTPF